MHYVIYPVLVLAGIVLGYSVRGLEHRKLQQAAAAAVAEYEKLAKYVTAAPGKVDEFLRSEIYRISDSLKKHLL